ncbi:MAG TPA: SIMPL domain-containing protein [Egibacteraceae bacterium]|nr:SIMPL domain-containing protein [Egibacteraceae bacterium]
MVASLRTFGAVVLLALLAAGCTSAAGQTTGSPGRFPPAEGITVVGQGRVTGTPDTLQATVGVEVARAAVQEALDAASTAARGVIDALRAAGVAEEDIQTREVTLQPRYEPPAAGAPRITGYVATNLVEVRLRDLARVGETLDAALRAGGDAARLQGVEFALEDNAQLLQDARAEAFDEARAKAEHYADLAGATLGRLVSIDESAGGLPPPIPLAVEEQMERHAAVPIAPGSQEVSVQVTALWQLR